MGGFPGQTTLSCDSSPTGLRVLSSYSPSRFLDRIGPRDPELRAAVGIALLFFSFTLMVFTVAGYFRGPESFQESLTIGLPMMIVDGPIGFTLFFLIRYANGLRPLPRWTLVALGVIVVALVQAVWDTQLRIWAGTVYNDYRTPYLSFVRSATLNTYNSGMFAALLVIQASNMKLREKERMLRASQDSERDAHMLALRFQLNPHFLFNTLNAISSLVVVGRAAEADAMIDRLSSFLRASLSADPHSKVSIADEFDMLDSYLEIESVRFSDRLETRIELPPHLGNARVPPFLLQPLVENAIKYAVAPATRPITVTIAAAEEGGRLLLTVADDGDGCGDVTPGTGVGLANVSERLRLNYGRNASVAKQQDSGGCRVDIRLPLDIEPAIRTQKLVA